MPDPTTTADPAPPTLDATWPCPECEGSGSVHENGDDWPCRACEGTGRVPLFESLPCGCWSHLVRLVGHHVEGCTDPTSERHALAEWAQAQVAVNAAREVVLIAALRWIHQREEAAVTGNSFAASAADQELQADVDLLRRALDYQADGRRPPTSPR